MKTLVLTALILSNKERLSASFPGTIKYFEEVDGAERFVTDRVKEHQQKQSYYFLIISENDKDLLGAVSIKSIDWTVPKAEIGYYIDGKHEGKGITTKAVEWLKNYSFNELGLQKLFARIDPTNEASKKVVIKNGFQLEGIMKNDFRNGAGELRDLAYYGLIKN